MQGYGGSSVADAEGILRVAKRVVDTRRDGHDVVVAVSAMGDTTDELLDLAAKVAPIPAPRELDMLLSSGERISMALLAMAIHSMGFEAYGLTGPQAGMMTDGTHGAARIVEVQGTAEKIPFTEEQFLELLALAKKGIAKLVDLQKMAVM